MIQNKLKLHLEDSLKLDGSVIDFRVYDAQNFSLILNTLKGSDKHCYGVDTFKGLGDPTQEDSRDPDTYRVKKGAFLINRSLTKLNIRSDNENYSLTETDNYNDLEWVIPELEKFCFALVDLKQFASTKKVLEYLWTRMTYGGTIFVANYHESSNHSEHIAIKAFVEAHDEEVNVSRQMMVNGVHEKFIAIKCLRDAVKPANWRSYTKSQKVTIAMVLKTGGEVYNYKYVNALAKSIKENVTVPHEVVVLTDNPKGFTWDVDRVIPLANNYPTWWSKIELFKPYQFDGPVFYFDLDTAIIGNIDDIVSYDGDFAGLRDFYGLHSLGSGLMGWNPKHTDKIYLDFAPRYSTIITNYKEGDQKWIDENKPSVEYLQDIYPNQIVSFKRHCLDKHGQIVIPEKAKIICFHGNPRPHSITHPVISKYWNS
jgi:hypothetical protein